MNAKTAIMRATKRPKSLDPPYPLSPSPPVPKPQPAQANDAEEAAPRTRYGDWHRDGIAWDF